MSVWFLEYVLHPTPNFTESYIVCLQWCPNGNSRGYLNRNPELAPQKRLRLVGHLCQIFSECGFLLSTGARSGGWSGVSTLCRGDSRRYQTCKRPASSRFSSTVSDLISLILMQHRITFLLTMMKMDYCATSVYPVSPTGKAQVLLRRPHTVALFDTSPRSYSPRERTGRLNLHALVTSIC
jgi:hypothetical protein